MRACDDPALATGGRGGLLVVIDVLRGTVPVDRRTPVEAVDLEPQAVRHPEGRARAGERGRRAAGEARREGRGVLVGHRPHLVRHGRGPVADDEAERLGSLGDEGRQGAAGDGLDGPADEFGQVDQVGADVREGPAAQRTGEAPGQGTARVARVVAVVATLDQRQRPQVAVRDVLGDAGHGGVAAIGEADAGHDARLARGALLELGHGAPVLERAGQRLLAEHVLAGAHQGLGDRAVQVVADDDRDDVDVGVVDDLLPAAHGLVVAVAPCAVLGEREVGVGDRGEPHRRQPIEVEHRGGHAPAVGVAAPGHPCADDGDGQGLRAVGHGDASLHLRPVDSPNRNVPVKSTLGPHRRPVNRLSGHDEEGSWQPDA